MSNTNKTYFIRLRPVSHYFFGGEQNFGTDTEVVNYRIRSRLFPQQTAIFGMLRYLLLLRDTTDIMSHHPAAGGTIANTTAATTLIGSKSFSPDKALNDFGIIEQLSPLLVYQATTTTAGENHYMPCYSTPADKGWTLKVEEAAHAYIGGTSKPLCKLENDEGQTFSYKNDKPAAFIRADGKPLRQDCIFKAYERVGIQKSYSGNTSEKAFFKQKTYGLNPGFYFGFYCTLKDTEQALPDSLEDTIHLGGERSRFQISIEKADLPTYPFPALAPADLPKLILISDAYLPMDVLNQYTAFVIGETKPFRYIKTKVGTKKYYNLSGKSTHQNEAEKSQRYTLLKKGAVLFAKDKAALDDLANMLQGASTSPTAERMKRFYKIGYNYFKK